MTAFYVCNGCREIAGEAAMVRSETADPFATGDTWYAEISLTCPACESDDVAECVPCDCNRNPALDGFDDCAACMLNGEYSHNSEYDAGDFFEARTWLQKNDPAELCFIEENQRRHRKPHAVAVTMQRGETK